jgi:P22 tail accessory factor
MATANDLILRARQRLGIDASEEPLAAVEQQDGFTALREMLAAWVMDGVIKAFSAANFVAVVTISIYDDSVLATESTAEVLAANLALRLADYYGVEPTKKTAIDAIMGKTAIQRKHFSALSAAVDYAPAERGIAAMPTQRRYRI